MKNKGIINSLWLVLLLVALSGCETYTKIGENQKLESRLYAYGKAARWNRADTLYQFLSPELLAVNIIPKNLDNIQVTGYKVLTPPVRTEEGLAAQVVQIEFMLKDRQSVKTLRDEQLWQVSSEDNKWYRANPIPMFK